MKEFKLLDCTLREAPIEELMWGDIEIKKMISGMEKANLDIIEIGFLKNNEYKFGSTSFRNVENMQPYLKKKKDGVMYVALVDYGRYDLKYLSNYDGNTIDAIRVCFKKEEIDDVLNYANAIRDKGYQVCIQHVDTLAYSDDEIISFIQKVNAFKPFSYSIIDTFGAMYEKDMVRLTSLAADVLDKDIWFGFHGHNNLMLADANAQGFVNKYFGNRKIIVDSSIYGCGRSAGNAHTELIARFMKKEYQYDYDIDELLDLIDTVIIPVGNEVTWGYSTPYFIAGMHNAHTFNVKHLLKRHNIKSKDLRKIIEMLDDKQKRAYNYALLEKLYIEYFDRYYDDTETINELTSIWKERKILLLAPGKSIVRHRDIVEKFILNNSPIVIGINNLIEGYVFDYIFYSGINRYQDLQYQNYRKAGSPKIIVCSNIKTDAEDNELIVNYSSLVKFGWVNLDSSAILLIRLMIKCGITDIYIAGLDGYSTDSDKSFYDWKLETQLRDDDKKEYTNDNYSMLKDIRDNYPFVTVNFLTNSPYKEIFN